MMLLAQAQTTGTGGILTPFVIIFGWIIRAIYSGLATMGIYNVWFMYYFIYISF